MTAAGIPEPIVTRNRDVVTIRRNGRWHVTVSPRGGRRESGGLTLCGRGYFEDDYRSDLASLVTGEGTGARYLCERCIEVAHDQAVELVTMWERLRDRAST